MFGSNDGTVRVWDIRRKEATRVLKHAKGCALAKSLLIGDFIHFIYSLKLTKVFTMFKY